MGISQDTHGSVKMSTHFFRTLHTETAQEVFGSGTSSRNCCEGSGRSVKNFHGGAVNV